MCTSESLCSSHALTDGIDGNVSVPFVLPRPPQGPSSKPTRRRPRVKSAGSDQTSVAGRHLRL